jgi:putative MATE family efflux protein
MNTSTKVDIKYSSIIKISAPIFLSILIQQFSFLFNTIFLGTLGTDHLAANGVASIYYLTLSMMCVGYNNGVQILLSRYAGMEDKKGLGKIFNHGLLLGISFSILLILISYFLISLIFRYAIHDPHIQSLSLQFIKIRIWGLPIFLFQQLCNQFFISTQNTRFILPGIILSTITNIILDYGLILGHFGLPQMGNAGAAIANIGAELIFLLSNLLLLLFYRHHRHFFLFQFQNLELKWIKSIFLLSLPVIGQYLFSIGSWLLFFIFVEHLGIIPSAINQICRSVFGVAGASTWALASTTESMVSNLIAQGELRKVYTVTKRIILIGTITTLIMSLPYILFPEKVLGIYTSDTNLIMQALPTLRIVILANLILAISTVVFNAVLGTGNTRYTLLIEAIAIIGYILYIYYFIEIKRSSLPVAWMSEFIYWTIILTLSIFYFKRVKWYKSKHLV